jgi:Flp pilus assembly protein TadG
MLTRHPHAPHGERGSTSIEFALIGGLLASLALLVIQLALLAYARQAAGYAAHDALAQAQAYGGNATTARDLGTQMLAQLTGALHDARITVHRDTRDASVTVTGATTPLLGYSQTITVTAHGPVEHFGAGT